MGAVKCDLYSVDEDTLCAVHWFDKDAVEPEWMERVKQSYHQYREAYVDEQIVIALMCDHPYRCYHPLGWSSKLALWSFGLNLFRGE